MEITKFHGDIRKFQKPLCSLCTLVSLWQKLTTKAWRSGGFTEALEKLAFNLAANYFHLRLSPSLRRPGKAINESCPCVARNYYNY